MIEVGYHTVCQTEVVWREDELVGPSIKLLQHTVCAHGSLRCLDDTGTDGANMMTIVLGGIDQVAALLVDDHLL